MRTFWQVQLVTRCCFQADKISIEGTHLELQVHICIESHHHTCTFQLSKSGSCNSLGKALAHSYNELAHIRGSRAHALQRRQLRCGSFGAAAPV